jgi:cytochrome c556
MLSLCAVLASSAFAATDPVTARQDIFKQFKKDAGAMGKMVKSDAINKEEFSKLAAHLDEVAQQPWQHFPAGSASGQTAKKTDAKAEIWSKPADWTKAVDNFKAETAKLKQVAAAVTPPASRTSLVRYRSPVRPATTPSAKTDRIFHLSQVRSRFC